MEAYFKKAIDYVYDLSIDSIQEDETIPTEIDLDDTMQIMDAVKFASVDDNQINDQQQELFSFVQNKFESEKEQLDYSFENQQSKLELKKRIKISMNKYKKECKDMNMSRYLEENGNKLYKTLVNNKKLDSSRITSWDVLYISKLFDATKWWQDHEIKYPELSLAATILLGKPTHNAFQERVFSRGTHTDTKLKKNTKEENFEMSVLNAVNGKQIDEIYNLMKPTIVTKEKDRLQFLKEFLEKRKNEADLTIDDGSDSDDGSKKNDGKKEAELEYASVCSQRTVDMISDDDDDDDDSSITAKYNTGD